MSPDRRRTRNRLFVIAILPALLLLLVSARATLLLVDEADAMAAYDTDRFETARDEFARNRVLNPVERWIAPFGEGAARHRDTDHTGAITAYEVALEHAPPEWECPVRNNLALAHEALGDAAAEEGETEDAEAAWAEGRAVLAGCLLLVPDPEDPLTPEELVALQQLLAQREDTEEQVEPLEDDRITTRVRTDRRTARQIDDRLADKLDEDEPRTTTRPDDPRRPDETFAERQRRLEERSRRALERRREQEQQREEFQDNRPDPPDSTPTPQW